MKRRTVAIGAVVAGVLAGLFPMLCGCPLSVAKNLTKERTGNISFAFINNTPYTAAFTFGTWDEWDRSPGTISIDQLLVAANTTTAPTQLTCGRSAAVGTQDLVDRVLATKADETDDFIPNAFAAEVHFSDAPAGSEAEALPTVGTALGKGVLLGVDYSCGDRLVFTFYEDPDAAGGFRVDFEVILDETKD